MSVQDDQIKVFKPSMGEDPDWNRDKIADFLYHALEQYGDPREHVMGAIEYALSSNEAKGGYIVITHQGSEITGAVVVNHTGMEGYIPEHFLVYIAVSSNHRGKGIGKVLMQRSIELAHGDIALHVEPENPAKLLYEKVGFTNKYLEMRFKQN